MGSKTVGIIGGGLSGVVSAKHMLDAGLFPTIFEKTTCLGGIWSPLSNHLHQTLRTNVSKYSCSFSDYSWMNLTGKYKNIPMFPYAHQVGGYVQGYANKFLAEAQINLSTEVQSVSFLSDTKKWNIKYCQHTHNNTSTSSREFDFLVITSGFFSKPVIPNITGCETFTGSIFHSSDAGIQLTTKELDVTGKTVVVIGGSLSGVELCGRLSNLNPSRLIHITNKAFWVLPTFIPEDPKSKAPTMLPLDMVLMAKIPRKPSIPQQLSHEENIRRRNAYLEGIFGNQYNIHPKLKVEKDGVGYLVISDNYAESVRSGKTEVIIGRLERINGSSLFISNSNQPVSNVDIIIFSTGFSTALPFMDQKLQEAIDFKEDDLFQPLTLFELMLHPSLPQCGFAGMYRGPYFTTIELQARYLSMIFSGSVPWPSVESQIAGIEEEQRIRYLVPRVQFPHANYRNTVDSLLQQMNLGLVQNSEYAFSAAYSKTEKSKKMIEDLTNDVEAARKFGKYVSHAIFRNLQGIWCVLNDPFRSTLLNQIARFTPVESNGVIVYNYSEHNSNDSHQFQASKPASETWEYIHDEDKLCWKVNGNTCENFQLSRHEKGWLMSPSTKLKNDENGCTAKYEFLFPFDGTYFNKFMIRWSCETKILGYKLYYRPSIEDIDTVKDYFKDFVELDHCQ